MSTPTRPAETAAPAISEEDAEALREAGRRWADVPRAGSAVPLPVDPDLERIETHGARPDERYVRVIRSRSQGFERVGPGRLQATPRASAPTGGVGRAVARLRTALIGRPMATHQLAHERLTKVKALAILSSDALSSVAYATEQIVFVLAAAGASALGFDLPIMAVIAFLLFAVVLSYRQTIKAYPQGGGSYIVAKDNLGPFFGLVAGAALMTDYILTVAVSVASGMDQVQSALPAAAQYRVELCVAMVVLIAIGNLRGLRESGNIFAAPTYLFIAAMLLTIGVSFFRLLTGSLHPGTTMINIPPSDREQPLSQLGGAALGFLLLRAFSSGCSAMTGVEAISDGVLAFKKPEWRNARATLTVMWLLLGVMFVGITLGNHILGTDLRDSADPCYQSVISQMAAHTFGSVPQCVNGHLTAMSTAGGAAAAGYALYIFAIVATTAVLILAANTSFSDFPRLFYFLARDDYAPHQFRRLGDRLAFSNGIIVLAALSSLLIVGFKGDVSKLIPLYAIGVFLAFTMSQAGMVKRWIARKEPGWQRGLPLNAIGMTMTAVVFIVTAVSKFAEGAWIIVIIVPALVALFYAIHRHYSDVQETLVTETPTTPEGVHLTCVVPIADLNDIALQSLVLARTMTPAVIAVHVCDSDEHMARLNARWKLWGDHVPLTVIESPYRSFIRPLLAYVAAIEKQRPDDTLVVVLPELVATRWWHQLLHNQTALRLKAALLFRPGIVVMSVPHHLGRHRRVRRRRKDVEAL